jgi:hypothetical protein
MSWKKYIACCVAVWLLIAGYIFYGDMVKVAYGGRGIRVVLIYRIRPANTS